MNTETRYRRVFITGASGFIGRALADCYRDLGAEVRGLDVRPDTERGVVAGDITRPETWEDQVSGSDLVIHTAAVVTNNVDPIEAWHVNVVGTQRVLEAARQAGAARFVQISTLGVMRFLYVGGEAVLKRNDFRPIDENWPLMPVDNPYADTKIAAEHLVLAAQAAGEIDCTIVRPADVYGPGCRPWVLQPLAMIRKGLFMLPEKGQGLFYPIYIDDLVRGIVMAAENETGRGQIFLFGAEFPVTTETYFGYFYRMLGKNTRPRSFSTPVATALAETARLLFTLAGKHTELGRGVMQMLSKKTTFSNAKAHTLLDWYPEIELEEGMRRTEAWLRSEGLL